MLSVIKLPIKVRRRPMNSKWCYSDQYVDFLVMHVLRAMDASSDGLQGIIYCKRRKDCDDLAEALKLRGLNAAHYQGGMTMVDRIRTQEEWMIEHTQIIVATVAFGMGINKTNVRFVFHDVMAKSLDDYMQEIGRAGRDGAYA